MKFKSMLAAAALGISFLAAHTVAADLKYKPGEDKKFTWSNLDDLKKVDLKGETLTIFGPWRGDDEKHIQVVLDYFREATGADVKYSSSENYEQQVVIDTSAGSPANISVLPQPGLIADLAAKGLRQHLHPCKRVNVRFAPDCDPRDSIGKGFADRSVAAQFVG